MHSSGPSDPTRSTGQESARVQTSLRALRSAGAVGAFAQSLAGTATALLAYRVGGSAAFAGLPPALLVAGAATAALAASRLTPARGRRTALSGGAGTALIGCAVIAVGSVRSELGAILAGSLLLGAGNIVIMLGRYAAADLVSEPRRTRAMASVLTWATTGTIAGPNLLEPTAAAAVHLGLPPLSGPFAFAGLGFAVAGAVLAVGYRDPQAEDRTGPREPEHAPNNAAGGSSNTGLAVLTLSNLVMVAVMTMAPVHLEHHGGGLTAIGLIVSAHLAGMFAPSPLSAWLARRHGDRRVAVLAGAVMFAACGLAAAGSGSTVVIAAAMTLLGVGWNLGLVAGSSLLTAGLPTESRLRREGIGEAGMGLAAAGGGAAAGPTMALGGYAAVAIGGAAAAGLLSAVAGISRSTSPPIPILASVRDRWRTPGADHGVSCRRGSCSSPQSTLGEHMFESKRGALIVVDMQNAFIGTGDRPGVPGSDEVVKAVNGLVADVADRWPVFYTKDVAPFDLPEEELRHLVELHPDLDVRGTVVPKGPGKDGGFSGFALAHEYVPEGAGPGTGALGPLAELLAWSKVDSVVVAGLAADVCVAATARDARRLGYEVTMPLHATAFVHAHPEGDEAAIRDLRTAGITVID